MIYFSLSGHALPNCFLYQSQSPGGCTGDIAIFGAREDAKNKFNVDLCPNYYYPTGPVPQSGSIPKHVDGIRGDNPYYQNPYLFAGCTRCYANFQECENAREAFFIAQSLSKMES